MAFWGGVRSCTGSSTRRRWRVSKRFTTALTPGFKVFVLASLGARGLRFMTEGVLLSLYGEQVARFLKSYFDVAALALVVVAVLGFLAVGWIGKLHATRTEEES